MKENGEIKKMGKCGKEKKNSNHMARNHTWISS